MTTRKALSIAMKNPTFIMHHDKVHKVVNYLKANPRAHVARVERLIFIVDGEYFYYGFNGREVEFGKYNYHTSLWLAEQGKGLLIREPY